MATKRELADEIDLVKRVGDALGLRFVTDVKLSAGVDASATVNVTMLLTDEQLAIILGKEV